MTVEHAIEHTHDGGLVLNSGLYRLRVDPDPALHSTRVSIVAPNVAAIIMLDVEQVDALHAALRGILGAA